MRVARAREAGRRPSTPLSFSLSLSLSFFLSFALSSLSSRVTPQRRASVENQSPRQICPWRARVFACSCDRHTMEPSNSKPHQQPLRSAKNSQLQLDDDERYSGSSVSPTLTSKSRVCVLYRCASLLRRVHETRVERESRERILIYCVWVKLIFRRSVERIRALPQPVAKLCGVPRDELCKSRSRMILVIKYSCFLRVSLLLLCRIVLRRQSRIFSFWKNRRRTF